MTNRTSSIAKRFYFYQKERFPMIVLAISLFPAILSSQAVVASQPNILMGLMALIASIAYLLHIRVIDEHRDFQHDNTHHVGRPVQTGAISREELSRIDTVAIIVIIGVAAFSGLYALGLAFVMLFYSYLAGKEFFFGEKIRKYFFFYNSINLLQMLLMQLFVYALFVGIFSFNRLVLAHFLFTTVGTITFEFVRKLKIPGDDGTGKDTYTHHLGFGTSIIVHVVLAVSNIFLFLNVVNLISNRPFTWLIFSVLLSIMVMFLGLVHWLKRKRLTDQVLQLSFLLSYGILNLIIYFVRF